MTGHKPTDRRILLARIGRAHGIRGEVFVQSFAADPESLGAYGPLTDADGQRSIVLHVVRTTLKGVVARIDGITDRTAAERLNGTELYVQRSRLPEPAAGEFYHEDLIGCRAVSPDGAALGEIVAVHNFGAGDLLEIRLEGVRETELIAFTDDFVPEVDLAAGRVVVVMPLAAPDDDPGADDDAGDSSGKDDGDAAGRIKRAKPQT